MKKVFLCGNTGSRNRGCEAIVRSTAKVIGARSGDIFLATFSPEQDMSMARDTGINLISYAKFPTSVHRYVCAIIRKIFKKSVAGQGIIQKPLFSRIGNNDICLNIGGDTYCYGRPIPSIALNRFTNKKGITNILWCCSVEKENIKGEILEDLKKYKYIFAREQLTYEALIDAGIDSSRVIKVCDPAFFLNMSEIDLPKGFKKGNTVGINVSEMTINSENPYAYSNVIALIRYILENTDMSVCLIPHVYSIKENENDYPILKKIYDEINSNRISIVGKEYNCEQLKYIISNCRFFVGARTHSTIAAYSSGVPTLVIGYSVKSKGIATDLFGTYDGYVIPYTELTEKNELLEAFKKIAENETEIKESLSSFLPQYKQQLSDAICKYILPEEKIEKPFEICCKEICSGCSACVNICPVNAISMKPDSEGFSYPVIDYSQCIYCGKCKKKCPVKNKYKEDNQEPQTFACINKNKNTRLESSSGGIFTLLAERVITDGGIVYGAAFDESFRLKHQRIEILADLSKLRGSKYVQSNTSYIYEKVKEDLASGRKVLYSGTPCQIGGLYAAVGKNNDNLITVDLACHGVPSPKVWEKYVTYRENKAGSKTKSISFRDKRTGWKKYSVTFKFENNTEYSMPLTEDLYMKGYLSHIFLRNSCTECSFKNIHRQADITLADYWGIESLQPEKNDDTGVSLVMIHSEVGKKLVSQIKNQMEVFPVQYKISTAENKSLVQSVKKSNLSRNFYKDFEKIPFDKLIEKYCGTGLCAKIRRKIAKNKGSEGKMAGSRTKNVLRNTAFSLIYKLSDILLAFILRTIFIQTLGMSYLGLSGLFTNILTVLSLMELGAGSAIVFSLYKPLAEGNNGKVAALMQLYKKTYNIIGILVCVAGVVITPFLKYIINLPDNVEHIYLIYWLSVANTAVSYFLAYRRSLLMADQRNDINTKNQIIFRFTRFIILAIILVTTHNFILYLLLDVINTLVSNIQITYVIKKRYAHIDKAEIDPLTKDEKRNIMKYMASGISSKIGQTVVTSTDNIVISAFISTVMVGIYSNYTMIISGFDSMIYLLFSNITASVGNFAVKKESKDSESLFKKINFANYLLAFVVTVCVYSLLSPFVAIWVGEDYLLSEVAVAVIVLNFYISINQYCVANFMGAVGKLYYINRYRSLIEGGVNLVASILLVKFTNLGITGVFLGTTVCFLCGRIWMDAHTLYKYWFKVPFIQYAKKYIIRFILCLIVSVASKYIVELFLGVVGLSIINWIISAFICLAISCGIIILIYSRTEEFKYFLNIVMRKKEK